jgi:hypothetical protein
VGSTPLSYYFIAKAEHLHRERRTREAARQPNQSTLWCLKGRLSPGSGSLVFRLTFHKAGVEHCRSSQGFFNGNGILDLLVLKYSVLARIGFMAQIRFNLRLLFAGERTNSTSEYKGASSISPMESMSCRGTDWIGTGDGVVGAAGEEVITQMMMKTSATCTRMSGCWRVCSNRLALTKGAW